MVHPSWMMLLNNAFPISGCFKQTQMLTKAMVPDYEANEQKQGEIYGKMMAISGVGITLGPVIGGHMAEDYPDHGFSFLSAVVGICFLINAGKTSNSSQ